MKIEVKGELRDFRSVWAENEKVFLINQTSLPEKFEVFECRTHEDIAYAIKSMVVRGAPAIGCAASYGIFLACAEFKKKKSCFDLFPVFLHDVENFMKSTRPTAVDLFNQVDKISKALKSCLSIDEAVEKAKLTADGIADENVYECIKIGEFGSKLIKDGFKILTHCNAGALACADYGTALGVIRKANESGKKIFVYVDETRPRLQGKLTSWELLNEGIPHKVIADNAAGYFMKAGCVDVVVVGADRIALNGDTANKIGTYEKAVLAHENNIPFYVAAPSSTIDRNCGEGSLIPIEFRCGDEVLYLDGKKIFPEGSTAENPSFDVTPAKYITGIITEKGVFKPGEVRNLF